MHGIDYILAIKDLNKMQIFLVTSNITCWSKYPPYAMNAADSNTSPTMVLICERNVSELASQRSRSITKLFNSAIDLSTWM